MIVLSLDTTSRAGSGAIVQDRRLLAERSGDAAVAHGQSLPGELMRLVEAAGIRLTDIDLLAVAAGPGSFTGLRIGIATVQGLAMATGKPIVPVSTLEALAHTCDAPGDDLIVPWVDAQRGEVFSALYEAGGERPIGEPTALAPEATLGALERAAHGRRLHFVGDGAVRYAPVIAAALGSRAAVALTVPMLAAAIARIAIAAPARAVAPHAVAPIYVRRPDVELVRDRRARPV